MVKLFRGNRFAHKFGCVVHDVEDVEEDVEEDKEDKDQNKNKNKSYIFSTTEAEEALATSHDAKQWVSDVKFSSDGST